MLQLLALSRRFGDTPVFDQVNLTLNSGEFVALLGESGVGKSTLLNCIAGLDHADSGSVLWHGQAIGALSEDERAQLRRRDMGFVFQAFHVLPHLSVQENVALPLLLLARPRAEVATRVAEVLQAVGLGPLAARLPAQLSGGQLQRVAIARAVVHRPALLLADEPTGNLDPDTADKVLEVLRQQVHASGAACLMVTHSRSAARRADRVLQLSPHGITPAAAEVRAAAGHAPDGMPDGEIGV